MMKPDTPKFALDEPTEDDLARHGYAEGYYCGKCAKCGTRWTDQDKRAWHCKECATKEWKGISAAPKPDCVGVEEIKKRVYELAFGGKLDDEADGDYLHVIDEVIDALKTLGLLAVKEKAQEGEIEGPDCEPRTAAEIPGLHKLLTEPGVLEKAQERGEETK